MLDTSRVAGHESSKRKQQFLQRIRYCKYIDREYKVAEIIFGNLNSKTGYQIAWPSEQSLSKTTGQNIRTIRQHVACLKALGVITVDRMGGSEFRAWAEQEFGLGPEDTRASTKSRHLMNVYRPLWNSHLWTTGQPSEEEVEKFLELKAIRRQGSITKVLKGDTEAARIQAPVPVFDTALVAL